MHGAGTPRRATRRCPFRVLFRLTLLPSTVEKRVHIRCVDPSIALWIVRITVTPPAAVGEPFPRSKSRGPSPRPAAMNETDLPSTTATVRTALGAAGAFRVAKRACLVRFFFHGAGITKAPATESGASV